MNKYITVNSLATIIGNSKDDFDIPPYIKIKTNEKILGRPMSIEVRPSIAEHDTASDSAKHILKESVYFALEFMKKELVITHQEAQSIIKKIICEIENES